MHSCVICQRPLHSVVEIDRKTCDPCARRTGNIVVPPPRRRNSPCAKCNHTKLVRVIPRELASDPVTAGASYGPMFAAYELRTRDGEVAPFHPRAGFGVLEAYICKGCGYVEWYCQDPNEIPIGPEYMTEEIETDGSTPFR